MNLLTVISGVVGSVLAQFAPWLQTPAKAAIAGVGGLVIAVYTHEHHATAREETKAAAAINVAKASAAPVIMPSVHDFAGAMGLLPFPLPTSDTAPPVAAPH